MTTCSLLLTALACLLAPLQQPGAGPTRPTPPPTQFFSQVMVDDLLMVVGTVESVTLFGIGTAVVRLRVDEHLLGFGPEDGETLLLLAVASEFHAGSKGLLVFEPFGQGGRYRVRFRIDSRDPDYTAKLAMSRRQIAVLDIDDTAEREDAIIDLLIRSLSSADAWTRRYAVSELRWIATVHPDVLDPARVRRMRAAALASRWPEVTDGVESVAIQMARRTEALRARADEESSSP